MNLFFHCFICVLSIFIIFIFYFWRKNLISDSTLLVIGILSARQNFNLREEGRSSWLKSYSFQENHFVKAWFIIGKEDCRIPPDYRLRTYECEKWDISKSDLTEYFYSSQVINEICDSKRKFEQGFSFRVNHPVVVKKLGILYGLLVENSAAKVAILDTQNKEILVQTTIFQNHSSLENGYLYEVTEPILLPKHYEGMVLVEGYLQHEACISVAWNDGGGVITFNHIYSTPSHLDNIKFRNDIYSAASVQFFVHDLDNLYDLISKEDNITTEWLSYLENINEKLIEENIKNQDLLFVDVVDTYRNLSLKLIHFYKWIYHNYEFSFLMKTDDDTVINVEKLIHHMNNHSTFDSEEIWLWSRFRNDWPVNYIGKWADFDYKSSLYPAFPCGALYIMSHKTVQWLSLNANFLFPYQGEDVSIGIWLSAIKTNLIEDKNFQCDSACNKRSYNRAQLTASEISKVWSTYKMCQNLCSCD